MKKTGFSLIFILFISFVFSQDKYWVSYTNKSCSEYDISNPKDFLSEKALARRQQFNIPIHHTDLPVCNSYINTINSLGAVVQNSSKWLNGSILLISDVSIVTNIKNLNFVKSIQQLTTTKTKSSHIKFNITETKIDTKSQISSDYGSGYNQINMLSGDFLHDLSYKGSGIEIAIMDNGFPSVDTNLFYQKANEENRIHAGYDFVNDNDTIYDNENGNHGNYVISTMVSDVEGKLIGTAPKATYYLFSTEDNANEGLPEEYNWAMAAEKADSLMGVHAIITTSLGYSNGFDIDSTNHTYSVMDGNTTPITIAADLAASKGFLVINSAGNEGSNTWKYLTAPSDGDSVLCIGAVDSKGTIAGFSSRGPSFDGRTKPNVCAKGLAAAAVTKFGNLTTVSGTSFSCPITSGMAACLWQAFPDKNNMEIFYAIEKSAHIYTNPNNDLGFGIPNFELAYYHLLNKDIAENEITIFPNPVENDFKFSFKNSSDLKNFNVIISNQVGETVSNREFSKNDFLNFYIFEDVSNLQDGIYYLSIQIGKEQFMTKFLKN